MDAVTLELYDELDSILAEQERDKFSSRSMRMILAKDFNRNLMNLYKVEEMWRVLQVGFARHRDPHNRGVSSKTLNHGVRSKTLTEILESFDMRLPEQANECIFKEASEMSRNGLVTPESLLVDSTTFQNHMLQDDADDVAQLLYRSHVLRALSWQSMQVLTASVRRVSLRPGQVIRLRERSIIAVQSGCVNVTYSVASKEVAQKANSPLTPSGSSHNSPIKKADSAQSSPVTRSIIHRSKDQSSVLHTAEFERDQVAGEAWAILGVAQVISISTEVNSSIVLLPWTSFGVMLEIRPQLYRTLCSTIVDMTYDLETGGQLRTGLRLLSFETELIYDMYMTATRKGTKALRNAVREAQASQELDDLENVLQKGKDQQQQDRDGAVRSLMDRAREAMAMEWSESMLKPAILALHMWKSSFKSKRVQKFESKEHEMRMTLRHGFEVIERSWAVIANGANTIYFTVCGEVLLARLSVI